MYFPGDPLFGLDPIYQSIVDPAARARLVAAYDHDVSEPEWAIGYRWDVVLTGPAVDVDGTGGRRPCLRPRSCRPRRRPSGPSSATPCRTRAAPRCAPPWHPSTRSGCTARVFDGAGDGIPDAVVEIWGADAAGGIIAERGSLARDGHAVTGFGRAAVDRDGHYSFTTIKPGVDARRMLRPTCSSRCSPAGSCTTSSRGPTSTTSPTATTGDRLLGDLDPARRSTLIARGRRRSELPFRHQAAGRRRDRLPRLRCGDRWR